MLIRKARKEELDLLLRWSEQFLKEVFPNRPVDKEHLRLFGTELITRHVVIVADDEGEVKGFIAGLYQPHFLNPNITMLQEIAWWVPEEHRKTGAGWALLKGFSALKNTDITSVGLLKQSGVAARHMEKLGYKEFETAWVKNNGNV